MRKESRYTVSTEGRDKGKTFLITEMPARRAERWATRALLKLTGSGAVVDPAVAEAGMAGIAALGLKAFAGLTFDAEVEALLDEMLTCVQRVEEKGTRPLIDEDVEDVSTLVMLRAEVLEVHVGFSVRDALSTLISEMKASRSSTIKTSRRSSAQSSPRSKRRSMS